MSNVRVKPPQAAQKAAAHALEVRASVAPSNRGGLTPQEAGKQGIGSGVARARDIAAGKEVDAKQVKAFFDRHQGNIDKAKAEGKTMKESKALQAEGLWGGQTKTPRASLRLSATGIEGRAGNGPRRRGRSRRATLDRGRRSMLRSM